MKRFALACLALAACAPQPPSSSAAAADPLAVRYEVRVGQAVLPNVRSVSIDGPDIELVEFRQGNQPQGSVTVAPGRVGVIRLVIRTDWAAGEQTMETWRAMLTGATPAPTSARQTIAIAITSAGATAPATYAFQRCLPSEHDMQLASQDTRIEQVWRATCESVQRS
jgi:hypothetical protein